MGAGVKLYLMVGLGAALGSVARYLCALMSLMFLGPVFPWGTLAVNVAGSFLIGFYFTLTEPDGRLFSSPITRQFVLAGFCGGFTTFSIFSLETLWLFERFGPLIAGANVVVSLGLWLAAVILGHMLAARLNRPRG